MGKTYTRFIAIKIKTLFASSVVSFVVSFIAWLFPHADDTAPHTDTSPTTLLAECELADAVAIEHALAVFSYQDSTVRNLIWSLKYHHNKRAGTLLGTTLALHAAEELSERQQFGNFLTPIIIPIPLHQKKERERGYNQSLIIAQAFTKSISFPKESLQPKALARTKYTNSLSWGTSRKQRYEHMQNAFMIPFPNLVKNKDVILIDDVITSGATMSAAKRVLLQAGARQVLLFAVAH